MAEKRIKVEAKFDKFTDSEGKEYTRWREAKDAVRKEVERLKTLYFTNGFDMTPGMKKGFF